jgi:hypothetical protein
MTKFGVGVGEEFPVDEQNRPQREQTEESGCCGSDWRRQHELRREAWRRFRHQMHAEWHARRRAMRDHLRQQDAVESLDLRGRHVGHLVIGALAIIGLAALFNHHSRS